MENVQGIDANRDNKVGFIFKRGKAHAPYLHTADHRVSTVRRPPPGRDDAVSASVPARTLVACVGEVVTR